MPNDIPTTKELREKLSKRIAKLVEASSTKKVAEQAEVTEPTIHNSISHPEKVKLETLEKIVEANS